MSANTLNIVSSFAQSKVALHGDMDVAFNTALTNDFIISFFSSTNEIFVLTSTLYKFRDFAGNLVSTIVFGGKHGLFVELALDSQTGVLYSTSNNIVATGSGNRPIRTKEIEVTTTIEPMDGSQADIFSLLLSNASTLSMPPLTNPVIGYPYLVYLQQDSAGSRLLNFNSKYKFPGGRVPTLSTMSGTIDLIKVTPRTADALFCEVIIGYSMTPVASVNEEKYDLMSSAMDAVQDGGTIWLLRTANLQETLATLRIDKSIAIAGLPGLMPTLKVDGTIRLSFGKAIINPEMGEVYVRDLQMTGAAVPAEGNGAAIRVNPSTRYLQVDNVKLYGNENGILTSSLNSTFSSPKDVFSIVIQDSEFDNNGYSETHKGRTHNLYAAESQRVYAVRSRFTNSQYGHDFKSRAHQNLLDRCVFSGSKEGRALDIPNGGVVHASNCYFRKPTSADQSNLVGIGQEGIINREQQYIFRNCLFENLKSSNYQLSFINQDPSSKITVYFVDCVFLGNTEEVYNIGPVEYIRTGGPLGPEGYNGPAGFIPKTATPTSGGTGYIPTPDQPVLINGPDPTLDWFPAPNSPAINPNTPSHAPVIVRTTSTKNYPGTDSGAGGGEIPPPPPDITPPIISISVSSNNVTERGLVAVTAVATDNIAIKKVEFYRDDVLINTVTSAPYNSISYFTAEDNGEITFTAKAFDTADNSTMSSAVPITVTIDDTPLPELMEFSIDPLTLDEYATAVSTAPVGSKRIAAANAIVAAMAPYYRIYVYSGNDLVIPIEYTGQLTVTTEESQVFIKAGVPDISIPVRSGDLLVNTWRFELQGGNGFTRKIIGSVGDIASGAMMTFDKNPEEGSGMVVNFALQLPAGLDTVV